MPRRRDSKTSCIANAKAQYGSPDCGEGGRDAPASGVRKAHGLPIANREGRSAGSNSSPRLCRRADRMSQKLELVPMPRRGVYESGRHCAHVLFPSGIVSLFHMLESGAREIAVVGREARWGSRSSWRREHDQPAVVEAGSAYRLSSQWVRESCAAAMQHLMRYTRALITQMAPDLRSPTPRFTDQRFLCCRRLLLSIDWLPSPENAAPEPIANVLGAPRGRDGGRGSSSRPA